MLLFILGLIVLLALLLFTPVGNRIMNPIVEKSLTSALSTPIQVQEFSLTYNRFQLLIQDDFGNTLSTQGGFSLLTLRMYAHYRIECFQKSGFNPIAQPFKTEGSLSGGIASFTIHGTGNIFGGNLLYQTELHRFHLASLHLKMEEIGYQKLLHLLGYPSKTDTLLSGEITLRGFDQRDIEGEIFLNTKTEHFTPTPIVEDSNESFTLKSLLADPNGQVRPFHIKVSLDASLEHAGVLEQFVGVPLAGGLTLKGRIEGDEKLLRLRASSDVARSDTSLTILIPDLEPSSITFDLKGGDAEQTFGLFATPSPIQGEISAYAELNASSGHINIAILNGVTIPTALKQHYQITQPLIHFDADVNADITQQGVHYQASFTSDLSRMEIDTTTTHDQMLRELLKTLR
ncbi:MAG: hypothetical protein A2552_03230 [Sulfuricurvum sp. RIFOXYD2_FULL_44_160]|nr:MAG: hypothetical protein A2552_03230 [Sulfuricurvum sp. RIFOXYD2_FULL_44_160]